MENKVQKLNNFKQKKDFFGQKNKLRLSLRTKKGLFWPKILIIIELKGQKLTNSKKKKKKKKKKYILGQRNKLGLSLRTKKRTFLVKNCEKIEFKYVKNLSEIAKIKQNKSNNGPRKG